MDLFESSEHTPPIEEKDYLTELVGEGKKFKDNAALARGKAESDAYIPTLKAEVDKLKSELQARLNMEDFLNQLKSTKEEPSSKDPVTPQTESQKGMNEEDIRRLIDGEYSKKEQERIRAQNLSSVQMELKNRFGPDYASALKTKAESLGLGQEFLNGLARENPKAFLALVGTSDRKPVENVSPPRNLFGMDNLSFKPSGKTYADFQELRRKDPHRYQSPEVQMEMHKLAQADPLAFGLKP